MRRVGTTLDGLTVVADIYDMCHTHGCPLGMLCAELFGRRCVPDWHSLLREILKEGVSLERAAAMLREAAEDAYEQPFRSGVLSGLDLMFSNWAQEDHDGRL